MTLEGAQGSYVLGQYFVPRHDTNWINFGEDVPDKSSRSKSSAAYALEAHLSGRYTVRTCLTNPLAFATTLFRPIFVRTFT